MVVEITIDIVAEQLFDKDCEENVPCMEFKYWMYYYGGIPYRMVPEKLKKLYRREAIQLIKIAPKASWPDSMLRSTR